jgi:hypothetical protein
MVENSFRDACFDRAAQARQHSFQEGRPWTD